MPNITFAVDDKALASAKAFASERGTTLNKLVSGFLGSIQADRPRPAVSVAEAVCLRYSLGQCSLMEATAALLLQDAGLMLALMRQSGLPMPQLTDGDIKRQAAESNDVFLEAFGLDKKAKPRKAKVVPR